MGLLRYILQGAGWEVGRQVAREGLDSLRDSEKPRTATAAELPDPREEAKRRKRQEKELERQLREMKKRLGR